MSEGFVFINYLQAMGFGHVAWGFALDRNLYCYGSCDHLLTAPLWHPTAMLKYMRVDAGDNLDYWCRQGTYLEMLDEVCKGPHIRYHAFQRIKLEDGQGRPQEALDVALRLKDEGWCIAGNNCVDQALKVLSAYGVPKSVLGREPGEVVPFAFPKRWFARFGEPVMLSEAPRNLKGHLVR